MGTPGLVMTPAVRADLAPTGKLRAAINYGNFILATKDTATGESRGVAVDLAQAIGKGLGVPVEIVPYDGGAVTGAAAPSGVWGLRFLGSASGRGEILSLTPADPEVGAASRVPRAPPPPTAAG